MEETKAFKIFYTINGLQKEAEIQPCCHEDNIVDYAVYEEGKLVFTIAPDIKDPGHWAIAMKNADEQINDSIVQSIGTEIDKRKNK